MSPIQAPPTKPLLPSLGHYGLPPALPPYKNITAFGRFPNHQPLQMAMAPLFSPGLLPVLDSPATSNSPGDPLGISSMKVANFDSATSASTLAQSLNEILVAQFDEAKINIDEAEINSPLFEMLEQGNYYKPPVDDRNSEFIIEPVPLDSFQLDGDHLRYLKFFCNDYTRVIAPLQPIRTVNPISNIMLSCAKNNNYLLAAMLACGALEAHRLSHNTKDEENYCGYLSTCIQLLSSILEDQAKVEQKVEPMILTVLLLTSYTAMTNIQKWRPHLKAAKELLATYIPTGVPNKRNPFITAFCRAWYSSIEVLAGLTAAQGGTMDTESEIDSIIFDLPNLQHCLNMIGMSRQDGYNYLYGYTNRHAMTLQRLTKYIRRFKKARHAPDISLLDIQSLLTEVLHNGEYHVISRNAIVPKTHFMHPDNNLSPPPDFEPLPPECVMKIQLDDNTEVCISWYDLSHQAYVWGAAVIILSMLMQLPKRNYLVQEAVHKFLGLMTPLLRSKKPIATYSMMMLECNFYVVGLSCIDADDRQLVVRYLQWLQVMGNVSARVHEEKLKRKWNRYDETRREIPIDQDFDDMDESELPHDVIGY